MNTQDKNQEKRESRGEALHGATSWVLHSLLANSSSLSSTLFYGAEWSLKIIPENFMVEHKSSSFVLQRGSNLIPMKRRLESEEVSWGGKGWSQHTPESLPASAMV